MAKTSQERGRQPVAIEFDIPVLERLRSDAKKQDRSVASLVRQIVSLFYLEDDIENHRPPKMLPRSDSTAGELRKRLEVDGITRGPKRKMSGESKHSRTRS